MQKRFVYPVFILFGILIVVVYFRCFNNPATTILLVRHAERAAGSDPPLTPAGHQRAGDLAHALQSAGIDAISVTDRLRTQQTADSVEAQLGLSNIVLAETAIAELVSQISNNYRGKTVLVVGHSHTLPDIIAGLGVSPPPSISANEFDNLFLIHKHRWGPILLTRLRYGAY